MSPHRIEALLLRIEEEHRLARRRQLIVYVLFFVAVFGLGYLYTEVRDLSNQNEQRLQENRVALMKIEDARRINNVCPDLQAVKALLRVNVKEQLSELKKPGTLDAYIRVYGDARGRRLYRKQLHDLPFYLRRLEPQKCSSPSVKTP